MVISGKYELIKHLGAGHFGEVYLGADVVTGEQVAIKFTKRDRKNSRPFLEAKLYRILGGTLGIPKFYTYGVDGKYNVLVIELLGQSLADQFSLCGRQFSLKTVLMLLDQIISRIQYLHDNNFLHRDIKPDNFVMGVGSRSHVVYMIDLGLAKKYKSASTDEHIPFKEGKSLTGTARYASVSNHLGNEKARRDDMVAIGYMMVYFLHGVLPWQGLKAEDRRDKFRKIMETKMATSIEELCSGIPEEFETYFRYLEQLDFEDRPDYDLYRQMFKELFRKEGFKHDYQYDWLIPSTGTGSPSRNQSYRNENLGTLLEDAAAKRKSSKRKKKKDRS